MNSQFFFLLALVLYSALFLFGIIFRLEDGRAGYRWYRAGLLLAILLLTVVIGARTREAGHLPLTNLYESLLIFAWFLGLVLIVWKSLPPIMHRLVLLFVMAVILSACLLPARYTTPTPLMPALKSHWITFHVLTCFSAYAAFAVAFGSALLYLVPPFRGSRSPESLEAITTTGISIGFPIWTIGIITGSVWANQTWGTYWSWDPKETWSLITWLIYAAFLHTRFTRGFRGKRAALLAVLGFLSVVFTYLGVTFILSGLHSYAS